MRKSTLLDRLRIVELARTGCTDTDIAEQVGWSRATVGKWRRRGRATDEKALVSHMGRPKRGALSHFPAVLATQLLEWRLAHPRWGATTLRAQAMQTPELHGLPIPSRSTLARWLKQQQLVRHHHRPPAEPAPASRPPPQAPHEVWELDAQGHQKVAGLGVVALIDLVDRFSRVKVLSYPCYLGAQRVERYPNQADYQVALRLAFQHWGLPDCLAVDRDAVYRKNTCASPFPTRLQLWLLGLGVQLQFGPAGRPTERGRVERSHQLWTDQVLVGAAFADWWELWHTLLARLDFLNRCLPCRTTGNQPPLLACPAAAYPRRPYHVHYEAQLFDLARVDTFLATQRWSRRASNLGCISLGARSYCPGATWAQHDVEVTSEPEQRQLIFHDLQTQTVCRRPIKALTAQDLIGDLSPSIQLMPVQIPMPFLLEAKDVPLFETSSATTF